MIERIVKWLRKNYHKVTSSIAFFPAVVAVVFLVISYFMLQFDYSEVGKNIKSHLSWLSLKDATTARTVVATILGGIISLTVFSFSMVMIVLNQAASQMSNRVLEDMIGNRFQQFVLGVYIGSIVYALFLLSNIRDITSGIYIPAISIYLLLLITVIDIFIFIYFLHYVTQSVKFQTIIDRVHDKTIRALEKVSDKLPSPSIVIPQQAAQKVTIPSSGYFQDFNKKELAAFACRHHGVIEFLYYRGDYVLKGVPFLNFYSEEKLLQSDIDSLFVMIDLYNGQPIEINPYYGFHQLAEVAVKALSPGINDPETAVLSIHSLSALFEYKLRYFTKCIFKDVNGDNRIQIKERTFEKLFTECFYPIRDYGKKDMYIQDALLQMVTQLASLDGNKLYAELFSEFLNAIESQQSLNKL